MINEYEHEVEVVKKERGFWYALGIVSIFAVVVVGVFGSLLMLMV